ncbi:hypothetical protein SORDD21_01796 [Streptococcus oralis]|uniref:Uncharacterized protein n=1 Tax=Streptococcus oralis TaxID=1303 RepID=A0A139PGR2_STROR|nr:hypothetical protein SORDD21_01796 [Streptococcus oralis]
MLPSAVLLTDMGDLVVTSPLWPKRVLLAGLTATQKGLTK